MFFLTILMLSACNKEDLIVNVKILGHRGLVNDTIRENTLKSAVAAWELADGIEIDIQSDADGEIWLFHDGAYINCEGLETCLPKTTGEQIQREKECGSLEYLTTLEDIFAYHRNNGLNKIISLDVKTWYDKNCFEQQGADNDFLDRKIEALYGLIINYDMAKHVIIETDSKYFLNSFKAKGLDVKRFLLGYTDFNNQVKTAIKKDYSGVSHDWRDPEVTKENIQYARRKGLEVQLWTPNIGDDLKKVYSLNPDYIQTDNIKFAVDSLKKE